MAEDVYTRVINEQILGNGDALLAAITGSSSSTTITVGTGANWHMLYPGRVVDVVTRATGAVKAARYGQHACYDRLVFDVAKGSGRLGYHVRYVTSVTSPGSGLPVTVAGGARLQVTINAPATARIPASGSVTFTGWRTFRQLKWVGSFEGYTDVGLGVRARLPMRTFVLDNADGSKRLVVDVAHSW